MRTTLNDSPLTGVVVYTGGQIRRDHPAVATMLVHGIDTLVTLNLADFTRFGGLIRAIPLLRGDGAAGEPAT